MSGNEQKQSEMTVLPVAIWIFPIIPPDVSPGIIGSGIFFFSTKYQGDKIISLIVHNEFLEI